MVGIELTVDREPFVERALAAGLVINCTHGNILRLFPPFIVAQTEIDHAVAMLRTVLAE